MRGGRGRGRGIEDKIATPRFERGKGI